MNQETRNRNFIIPHSTNKSYPFTGMPSKAAAPKRVGVRQEPDGKIGILIDYADFDTESEEAKNLIEELKLRVNDKRTAFEDFLLFRLFEINEALKLAEGQIADILEEQPFVPEDFGFEIIHKQSSAAEPPQRIYGSKYHPGVALFRKPGDINDEKWDPTIWTIQIFENGNLTHEDEVRLDCHRIAYAYFYAKRIVVDAPEVQEFEK